MVKENYHDKGYKLLLSKKRNFIKFLRRFVKDDWVRHIDERSLRLCDKGFIDPFFKELESDLIYSAKIDGRDVYLYILTELQSSVDFTMPFRLFKYIAAILMRVFNDTPANERERAGFRLPLVIPIVFYNGRDKWFATRNFRDYLQDGNLYKGVIDFEYTLVDSNLLDEEYLLNNRDAISAAIAVDKVQAGGPEHLYNILKAIVSSKTEFDPSEFEDFTTWLKHTIEHRTGYEAEAEMVVELIDKGDDVMMRTGIDGFIDYAEAKGEAKGIAKGIIESAILLLNKGKSIQEAADLLDLSDSQIEQVKINAGLTAQLV